ncbi:hypothetical protein [Roseomonas gilardii]|uniref:hypothetical protein n=1 Tax=Roseomonas gilardii TaxID=257708 RepID=UPI000E00EC56|nr:hypothetical protein [Roseomonas gilardii]SUE44013.1 Uncharacterised protein [Roseomonas gilardii subsp. rosea]
MRGIFEQFDKVKDFPHLVRGRVEVRDGRTYVIIFDPKQVKKHFETSAFTIWDQIPGLKEKAILAFIRYCTKASVRSHSSRQRAADLFTDLARMLIKAGMDDRSDETLTPYDCEDILGIIASRELVRPDQAVPPLRAIVDEIWRDESLNGIRHPYLFVRRVPFPGSATRGGTRQVLPDAVFGDLRNRAAADCYRIMEEVQSFRSRLERPQERTNALQTAEDFAVWVYGIYGDDLPNIKDLAKEHRTIARTIKGTCGWKEVVRLIHPTLPNLMPFMALLGCYTLFNKAVMTELSLDDIERTTFLGSVRIVFTPLKIRAGRVQLKSFQIDDTPDNPDRLVRFLESYTAGIRQLVAPAFRRRLYLFWSLGVRKREGAAGPTGFAGSRTGSGHEDSRFSYAWSNWCEDSGFPGLQFASIRPTGLNLGFRRFNGDVLAVAALGSHSSIDVFNINYKSAPSAALNARRMGKAMAVRQRMLDSDGKIDPTRRLRGEGTQAATPGFGCLDVTSSPMPGQKKGVICSAYGQCPGCPLATTNSGVAANLARMKQLEAEYVAASTYLDPHNWTNKYSGHLRLLREEWLPAFVDEDVIAEASKLLVSPLAPLG